MIFRSADEVRSAASWLFFPAPGANVMPQYGRCESTLRISSRIAAVRSHLSSNTPESSAIVEVDLSASETTSSGILPFRKVRLFPQTLFPKIYVKSRLQWQQRRNIFLSIWGRQSRTETDQPSIHTRT